MSNNVTADPLLYNLDRLLDFHSDHFNQSVSTIQSQMTILQNEIQQESTPSMRNDHASSTAAKRPRSSYQSQIPLPSDMTSLQHSFDMFVLAHKSLKFEVSKLKSHLSTSVRESQESNSTASVLSDSVCFDEHTINNANPLSILKDIGLDLLDPPTAPDVPYFDSLLSGKLKASAAEKDSLYSYQQQSHNGGFICTFAFRDITVIGASCLQKNAAKADTVSKALAIMKSTPQYIPFFLKDVPGVVTDSPTININHSNLCNFIRDSGCAHGRSMQEVFIQPVSQSDDFECQFNYNHIMIAIGKGSTEQQARENASKRVLQRLYYAIHYVCQNGLAVLNNL